MTPDEETYGEVVGCLLLVAWGLLFVTACVMVGYLLSEIVGMVR